MITLQPLTTDVALAAAEWRNRSIESCRTPEGSTVETQTNWYEHLDPKRHRYWSVYEGSTAVGLAGLTNISWENRSAEISIVLDPARRGKGMGKEAIEALMDHGFNRMNLDVIYGECYHCSPALPFWKKVMASATWVTLPDRKYWNGKYWNADYFSVRRTK